MNENSENSENFKYLKPIPKQWNYKGTFNSFLRKQELNKNQNSGIPANIRYKSIPILYQFQQNLSDIWKEFEENSLITNRGCLKQLATMNISSSVRFCAFKLYKARDAKTGAILNNYILELENYIDERTLENYQQSFCIGASVAGMLLKNGEFSPEFNTYKSSNFKLNLKTRTSSCPINLGTEMPYFIQPKNSIKVYYTSEIDAFIREGYGNKAKNIPVEIKAKVDVNNNMDISPKAAFSTALQCQLADVNDIIYGFHDGERIQNVKHFSLQDLKKLLPKMKSVVLKKQFQKQNFF